MKRSTADNKATTGASDKKASIRLLLHCTDGVVPYLAPELLKKCFPADAVANVLLLGLAVKDTCVAPVYQAIKGGATTTTTTAAAAAAAAAADTQQPRKPRGYTFSDAVSVDPWLQDYTRITVPTYCLHQDALDKHNDKGKNKDNGNNAISVAVTSQQVLLWTANGRARLTPALYYGACTGLQSHIQVPLFDSLVSEQPQTGMPQKAIAPSTRKRKMAALQRTRGFLQDFLVRQAQTGTAQDGKVWAPYLVDAVGHGDGDNETAVNDDDAAATAAAAAAAAAAADDDDDDGTVPLSFRPHFKSLHQEQMEVLQKAVAADNVTGVALVGWQHVADSSRRQAILRDVMIQLESQRDATTVAVLSTNTLVQILEAALTGVNVIGSRLPTVWAQSRKAFVLDYLTGNSAKRIRLDETAVNFNAELHLDADGCLDLTANNDDPAEHAWFHDSRPIMDGCQCLTCRMHTRSYIYHLVCAKELLAEILLFVHNLHHLLQILQEFQCAHASKQVEELYNHMIDQLPGE